jgi:hypothetical protein
LRVIKTRAFIATTPSCFDKLSMRILFDPHAFRLSKGEEGLIYWTSTGPLFSPCTDSGMIPKRFATSL